MPILSNFPGGSDRVVELNGVLPAADWVEKKVTVTGLPEIEADSKGVIGLAQSATEEERTAMKKASLFLISQGEGEFTVEAYGVTPKVDIPYTILIVG